MDAAIKPDYQIYDLIDGSPENIGPRMQKKLKALEKVLPEDLTGKTVLDVGCDMGFWSFLCSSRGASSVLGLDRGRDVKGHGYVDLPEYNNSRAEGTSCEFKKINIGAQWELFGKRDIVLLMSLYHHIYNQCEKHEPIWYWLFRHVKDLLIWENPTETDDSVVRINVESHLLPGYNKKAILDAAGRYFDYEYIGPAEHETTRSVYAFRPKKLTPKHMSGLAVNGAGGATKAFLHNDGYRTKQIKRALGIDAYPGSLNVVLSENFDWDHGYFRARIPDVANRREGLDSMWISRWGRFYPLLVSGIFGYAFRFEGESYPDNFIEIISHKRIRDELDGESVSVSRSS